MFGLAGTEPLIVTEAWAHPCVSENHGDEACVDLHEGVAAPRQYGAHPAAVVLSIAPPVAARDMSGRADDRPGRRAAVHRHDRRHEPGLRCAVLAAVIRDHALTAADQR